MEEARARECRFRSEPAIALESGPLCAVFVPGVGMTGVSLRHHGREHLSLPGGLDALRAGHTGGLPLLAPWANRLGALRYRAAGVSVDLAGLPLHTDAHGLPMHGLLVGRPGWRVDRIGVRRGAAVLAASIAIDDPAFPFPHRVEVEVAATEDRLAVATTVVPTGRRRVPIAFGWHPYLRLPDAPRLDWTLRLPAMRHLVLDERGIPTGESHLVPAEAAPIGRRTFDDGYELTRGRTLALTAPFEAPRLSRDPGEDPGEDPGAARGKDKEGSGRLALRVGEGYGAVQVWVPPGRPFVALEPMTARTNALGDGTAQCVEPGDAFTARFALELSPGR